MLRLLAFVIVVGLGAVWLEPHWDGSARALTLRLRDSQDVARLGRDLAAALFDRAVSALDEGEVTPPVAAGPLPSERHTAAERERLDRLIEEKTRE